MDCRHGLYYNDVTLLCFEKHLLLSLTTEKSCDEGSPKQQDYEAQLQLFDMTELVWSLAEILFIDVQPSMIHYFVYVSTKVT